MPNNQENIKSWIEQSKIDYIGHYIKAWIPFNAWYNNVFPSLNSDREKISAIKKEANTVRNAINSYMETEAQEGSSFRSYISGLYFQLQQNEIYGRDDRIWFETILKEKNSDNLINNEAFRHNKYYLSRTDGRNLGDVTEIKVVLKKKSNNQTVFTYIHPNYDLEHLQSNSEFKKLSQNQQENIRLLFEKLTPIKTYSIIENNIKENPKNYYECDSYNFRREVLDENCKSIYVCKALIEILYQLRNVVFHGELVPNDGAQNVYKEAYHLLRMILDKIR